MVVGAWWASKSRFNFGFGFRASGQEFRFKVQSFGFRLKSVGFRLKSLGFRVKSLAVWSLGSLGPFRV